MNNKILKIMDKMIEFDKGDAARIQHFTKVYEYGHIIGLNEGLSEEEQYILDVSSILHDIGILPSEKKYGNCSPFNQEKEGALEGRKLLISLGEDEKIIDKVCYIIGHHHTYDNINSLPYQIVVEADFLVNLFEENASKEKIINAKKLFKTKYGIRLFDLMFDKIINNNYL